jgi:hypothetical protein
MHLLKGGENMDIKFTEDFQPKLLWLEGYEAIERLMDYVLVTEEHRILRIQLLEGSWKTYMVEYV